MKQNLKKIPRKGGPRKKHAKMVAHGGGSVSGVHSKPGSDMGKLKKSKGRGFGNV